MRRDRIDILRPLSHRSACTRCEVRPVVNVTCSVCRRDVRVGTMFVGAIVLIVLVGLCAVLGAIYSYIYFTRINPRGGRKLAALSGGAAGGSSDTGGGGGGATHMFLFR